MYYKCELLVDGNAYAVTDRIRNWEDVSMSFKRNDYDGVVRTFTDKFEFILGARELLLNEYRKNYLKASAVVIVYTRTNSWEWAERFRCALNFSTLSDDGYVLSMNAIDDSVASLIKAKKGTQYEYVVDEVKDGMPLEYDGMDMANNVVMTVPPNNSDTDTTDIVMEENGYYTVPLYVETSEIVRKGEQELTDQMEDFYTASEWISEQPCFLKNESQQTLMVRIQAQLNVFYNSTQTGERNDEFYIRGVARNKLPIQYYYHKFQTVAFTHILEVDVYAMVPPGFCLQMFLFSQYGKAAVRITSPEKPALTWTSRRDSVLMDVIKPVTLLNRLLKSMNGGKEGLTGVIEPSGEKRLDNAMILAAESVRKLPGAKIYSSFTKFCEWMKSVFGYVYDINGNVVTFRPRRDYFGEETVKTIGNYNGYGMSVNPSLIYSQVNIGYEKQDYDSVNGKDEFRFTNIYNTGITITDNKLELISPYRADAYGIEFLAQTIGEDTTDDSSDTDVFFVCVKESGGRYELDRDDRISGVISPLTMFNVMYSPTSMIEANKDFLGGLVSELEYASSEGNTSVVINGEVENRNVALDGGLFVVDEVEVETSDIDLPEDMTGVVELHHQGEVVRGYYKSADFHYTKTKSAKITLIIKK